MQAEMFNLVMLELPTTPLNQSLPECLTQLGISMTTPMPCGLFT